MIRGCLIRLPVFKQVLEMMMNMMLMISLYSKIDQMSVCIRVLRKQKMNKMESINIFIIKDELEEVSPWNSKRATIFLVWTSSSPIQWLRR